MAEAEKFSPHAVQNITDLVQANRDAAAAVSALDSELKALKVASRLLNGDPVELNEKTASHLFVQAAQRVGDRERSLNDVDDSIDTDFADLRKELKERVDLVESSLETARPLRQKFSMSALDAVLACLSKCQDVDDALEAIGDQESFLIHLAIPKGTEIGKASDQLGVAGEVTPGSDLESWNANVVVLRARQAAKDRRQLKIKKAGL